MDSASYQTAKVLKSKVSIMKEPLLRRVLSGEKITEAENIKLDTIYEVEEMIEDYINELQGEFYQSYVQHIVFWN